MKMRIQFWGAHLLGHNSEVLINIFAMVIRLNTSLKKLKGKCSFIRFYKCIRQNINIMNLIIRLKIEKT